MSGRLTGLMRRSATDHGDAALQALLCRSHDDYLAYGSNITLAGEVSAILTGRAPVRLPVVHWLF